MYLILTGEIGSAAREPAEDFVGIAGTSFEARGIPGSTNQVAEETRGFEGTTGSTSRL